MRAAALREVGGFDPTMIAGEEPELCRRLRAAGWRIMRLPVPMTIHDAAMTRLNQWWLRAVRSGFGTRALAVSNFFCSRCMLST